VYIRAPEGDERVSREVVAIAKNGAILRGAGWEQQG